MSIIFISSALVSALNFSPNQQARLCTGKCSAPMAQLRPLFCSHRSTNRRQRSVELSPETPKKVQNNRATQQAAWFGAHTSWVPQKHLKSHRCLPCLLIHPLFITASRAIRPQLHHNIPVTDRHPPNSPKFPDGHMCCISAEWNSRGRIQSQAFKKVITEETWTLHNSTSMSIYLRVMEWYLEFIVLQHPWMFM